MQNQFVIPWDCINMWWFFEVRYNPAVACASSLKYFSCHLNAGKLKRNTSTNSKDTSKNGNPDHIAAQTFSFRELATATRNFRAECLLGEGGFGRVYKGRLESINQVNLFSICLWKIGESCWELECSSSCQCSSSAQIYLLTARTID